jgi:hypothetical protein
MRSACELKLMETIRLACSRRDSSRLLDQRRLREILAILVERELRLGLPIARLEIEAAQ